MLVQDIRLRPPVVPARAGLHARRAHHPRARHRRHHGDLHDRRRRAAAPASLPRSRRIVRVARDRRRARNGARSQPRTIATRSATRAASPRSPGYRQDIVDLTGGARAGPPHRRSKRPPRSSMCSMRRRCWAAPITSATDKPGAARRGDRAKRMWHQQFGGDPNGDRHAGLG